MKTTAAMKVIRGERVPTVIDTGFFRYDKTTIDEQKIAAVLYQ
jgi:ribose transport system substrate-binding protein